MIQTAQGSLVMLGLNTEAPQVFWNGTLVPGISSIQVDNDGTLHRVVLGMKEDPTVVELKAAGVSVKRV